MQDLRTKRPRFPASEKQIAYLRSLAGDHGLGRVALDAWLRARWGAVVDELDNVSASMLIDEVRGWTGVPEDVKAACDAVLGRHR